MNNFLPFIEKLLSGTLPFVLLMFCGVYLTFKSGFMQLTRFGDSVRLTVKAFKAPKTQGISSYQSACTALSATVGTGNIAGVAGAISLGGAGAVFWMWVSAVLGMAIKASEITLAILFRKNHPSEPKGGPMYYIEYGIKESLKPLSILFCLVAVPAIFCSGNMTQMNAAVTSITVKPVPRIALGIIFAALTLFAIMGGFKRITFITEKTVPIMSVLFILLSLGVIIKNISFLPDALSMIFKGAFSPRAVTGGAVGSVTAAIFTGASRGIFSNEAGLGTSAMAHSVAVDANARTQGLFGIFEVFIDTILLCTLTSLTILCSSVNINYGETASSELVAEALYSCYGFVSQMMLGIMMSLFAFSSIIGWAFYGKLCTEYIFGKKGEKIFVTLYPLTCIAGAICNTALVWRFSALLNGIMLCINLAVLLLLSDKFISYLKKENKNVFKKN